jgi:hypothetical protein
MSQKIEILSGINTPDDWWALVDHHWVALVAILLMFETPDEKKSLEELADKPLAARATAYKRERNGNKLARLFNTAFHNAPDHASIHKIESWGVLCDLCSEEGVLYEHSENDIPIETLEIGAEQEDKEAMDLTDAVLKLVDMDIKLEEAMRLLKSIVGCVPELWDNRKWYQDYETLKKVYEKA